MLADDKRKKKWKKESNFHNANKIVAIGIYCVLQWIFMLWWVKQNIDFSHPRACHQWLTLIDRVITAYLASSVNINKQLNTMNIQRCFQWKPYHVGRKSVCNSVNVLWIIAAKKNLANKFSLKFEKMRYNIVNGV